MLFLIFAPGPRMKWALSMGEKYLTECDYTQAVTMFSRAIRVDARSEPAYLGRAEAYIQLNQPAAAVEDLTFVIDELTTDDADVYIQRAEAIRCRATPTPPRPTSTLPPALAQTRPPPRKPSPPSPPNRPRRAPQPRRGKNRAPKGSSASKALATAIFFYDEDGRLTHITLDGYDIYIDYTDGKASAAFDEAQVNAMDDPHYILEIHEMTLKADGTIDTLYAYLPDVFAYIEFNEDGLPSYFTIAQDDLGQLNYLLPHRGWSPYHG